MLLYAAQIYVLTFDKNCSAYAFSLIWYINCFQNVTVKMPQFYTKKEFLWEIALFLCTESRGYIPTFDNDIIVSYKRPRYEKSEANY